MRVSCLKCSSWERPGNSFLSSCSSGKLEVNEADRDDLVVGWLPIDHEPAEHLDEPWVVRVVLQVVDEVVLHLHVLLDNGQGDGDVKYCARKQILGQIVVLGLFFLREQESDKGKAADDKDDHHWNETCRARWNIWMVEIVSTGGEGSDWPPWYVRLFAI